MNVIPVTIHSSTGKYPQYAHSTDAGFDIASSENVTIKPHTVAAIGTGLYISIMPGFELQIRSRSGLASKGIMVANSPGTIDCGYSGEIKVLLYNSTDSDFAVNEGDRVAQGVINEFYTAQFFPTNDINEITEKNRMHSTRGAGGFGSTGK